MLSEQPMKQLPTGQHLSIEATCSLVLCITHGQCDTDFSVPSRVNQVNPEAVQKCAPQANRGQFGQILVRFCHATHEWIAYHCANRFRLNEATSHAESRDNQAPPGRAVRRKTRRAYGTGQSVGVVLTHSFSPARYSAVRFFVVPYPQHQHEVKTNGIDRNPLEQRWR